MSPSLLTIYSFWFLALQIFFPEVGLAQGSTDGIYFILDEGRCRDNKVKLINARGKVCVPDNPVILLEEIGEIGEITVNEITGLRVLPLQLTETGAEKLAAVTKIYQGKRLAFLLEGKVVSILQIKQTIVSGKVKLVESEQGNTLDYTIALLTQKLEN